MNRKRSAILEIIILYLIMTHEMDFYHLKEFYFYMDVELPAWEKVQGGTNVINL